MIVYTGGTFDGLHVGHLELLEACRALAGAEGRVVVGLNRDEFVVRYKRRAPVHTYPVRAELLRSCRFVDLVVCNVGDESSATALDVARPDVIAIGSDWLDPGAPDPEARYLAQLGITHAWLDERGLAVRYIPRTRGVSSSAMRPVMAAYYAAQDAVRIE